MKCPFCNALDTQVKDSRQSNDGKSIKRRRYCSACDTRFTTYERMQNRDIMVVKKDGSRRNFDREKLFKSISIATRKRDISPEEIDSMIDGIINNIEHNVDGEITSKEIGELVMNELSKLDDVAYVRFSSVYHDFNNISDFENFLHTINKDKTR
ncbi:MAG: transcriptional regulator NrdR [Rickettsiales bacterium]